MKSYDSSYNGDNCRILLVGDISRAFLNSEAVKEKRFEVCANILDAIDTAAKKEFAVIAIVMFGLSAKLGSALKALRDSCEAKIILLAQMYEEPIARRLVGSAPNGTSVADDYLICPVQPDRFYESIMNTRGHKSSETTSFIDLERTQSASVDKNVEMRIKHLEKLATEDDLTGLKNRRYIWEFSRQIIEHSRKENGQVTLLVFDIDNFKHYNDVYGHCAGNEILKQAAVLMRRCCRSHDVVGRIGGDEFAVVFWDDPSLTAAGEALGYGTPAEVAERRSSRAEHPKEAIFIARRFIRELEKAPALSCESKSGSGLGRQGKGILTISGGLASFPRDGQTIEELFQQADEALLKAKRSGKNRIYLVGKPQSDINNIE